MKIKVNITGEELQDVLYLYSGLYKPLKGFMTNMEYRSVVDNMRLPNNMIWTLPITMDIAENVYNKINGYGSLYLYYKNEYIGFIDASDYYKVDVSSDLEKVYGTKNLNHPGVIREIKRSPYRIGGKVIVENESFLINVLKPEKTRKSRCKTVERN